MRMNCTSKHFRGFVQGLQESFWGDFQGQTRQALMELSEKDAGDAKVAGIPAHQHPTSPPCDYWTAICPRISPPGNRVVCMFA